MGNASSSRGGGGSAVLLEGPISAELSTAFLKFNARELVLLKQTFVELAERTHPSHVIDRETFLRVFPLPGLLGERLFSVFDKRGDGKISYDEFVCGLATCVRGSLDEKITFLFNMWDLSGDGSVTRSELSTILNQLPRSVIQCLDTASSEGGGAGIEPEATDSHWPTTSTVEKLVAQAFAETDLDTDGRLDYDGFSTWLRNSPQMLVFVTSFFPSDPMSSTAIATSGGWLTPSGGGSSGSAIQRQGSGRGGGTGGGAGQSGINSSSSSRKVSEDGTISGPAAASSSTAGRRLGVAGWRRGLLGMSPAAALGTPQAAAVPAAAAADTSETAGLASTAPPSPSLGPPVAALEEAQPLAQPLPTAALPVGDLEARAAPSLLPVDKPSGSGVVAPRSHRSRVVQQPQSQQTPPEGARSHVEVPHLAPSSRAASQGQLLLEDHPVTLLLVTPRSVEPRTTPNPSPKAQPSSSPTQRRAIGKKPSPPAAAAAVHGPAASGRLPADGAATAGVSVGVVSARAAAVAVLPSSAAVPGGAVAHRALRIRAQSESLGLGRSPTAGSSSSSRHAEAGNSGSSSGRAHAHELVGEAPRADLHGTGIQLLLPAGDAPSSSSQSIHSAIAAATHAAASLLSSRGVGVNLVGAAALSDAKGPDPASSVLFLAHPSAELLSSTAATASASAAGGGGGLVHRVSNTTSSRGRGGGHPARRRHSHGDASRGSEDDGAESSSSGGDSDDGDFELFSPTEGEDVGGGEGGEEQGGDLGAGESAEEDDGDEGDYGTAGGTLPAARPPLVSAPAAATRTSKPPPREESSQRRRRKRVRAMQQQGGGPGGAPGSYTSPWGGGARSLGGAVPGGGNSSTLVSPQLRLQVESGTEDGEEEGEGSAAAPLRRRSSVDVVDDEAWRAFRASLAPGEEREEGGDAGTAQPPSSLLQGRNVRSSLFPLAGGPPQPPFQVTVSSGESVLPGPTTAPRVASGTGPTRKVRLRSGATASATGSAACSRSGSFSASGGGGGEGAAVAARGAALHASSSNERNEPGEPALGAGYSAAASALAAGLGLPLAPTLRADTAPVPPSTSTLSPARGAPAAASRAGTSVFSPAAAATLYSALDAGASLHQWVQHSGASRPRAISDTLAEVELEALAELEAEAMHMLEAQMFGLSAAVNDSSPPPQPGDLDLQDPPLRSSAGSSHNLAVGSALAPASRTHRLGGPSSHAGEDNLLRIALSSASSSTAALGAAAESGAPRGATAPSPLAGSPAALGLPPRPITPIERGLSGASQPPPTRGASSPSLLLLPLPDIGRPDSRGTPATFRGGVAVGGSGKALDARGGATAPVSTAAAAGGPSSSSSTSRNAPWLLGASAAPSAASSSVPETEPPANNPASSTGSQPPQVDKPARRRGGTGIRGFLQALLGRKKAIVTSTAPTPGPPLLDSPPPPAAGHPSLLEEAGAATPSAPTPPVLLAAAPALPPAGNRSSGRFKAGVAPASSSAAAAFVRAPGDPHLAHLRQASGDNLRFHLLHQMQAGALQLGTPKSAGSRPAGSPSSSPPSLQPRLGGDGEAAPAHIPPPHTSPLESYFDFSFESSPKVPTHQPAPGPPHTLSHLRLPILRSTSSFPDAFPRRKSTAAAAAAAASDTASRSARPYWSLQQAPAAAAPPLDPAPPCTHADLVLDLHPNATVSGVTWAHYAALMTRPSPVVPRALEAPAGIGARRSTAPRRAGDSRAAAAGSGGHERQPPLPSEGGGAGAPMPPEPGHPPATVAATVAATAAAASCGVIRVSTAGETTSSGGTGSTGSASGPGLPTALQQQHESRARFSLAQFSRGMGQASWVPPGASASHPSPANPFVVAASGSPGAAPPSAGEVTRGIRAGAGDVTAGGGGGAKEAAGPPGGGAVGGGKGGWGRGASAAGRGVPAPSAQWSTAAVYSGAGTRGGLLQQLPPDLELGPVHETPTRGTGAGGQELPAAAPHLVPTGHDSSEELGPGELRFTGSPGASGGGAGTVSTTAAMRYRSAAPQPLVAQPPPLQQQSVGPGPPSGRSGSSSAAPAAPGLPLGGAPAPATAPAPAVSTTPAHAPTAAAAAAPSAAAATAGHAPTPPAPTPLPNPRGPPARSRVSTAVSSSALALSSTTAAAAAAAAAAQSTAEHEGWLFKVGQRLRTYRRRWYYLQGAFLYWYSSHTQGEPRGVLFLEGSIVSALGTGRPAATAPKQQAAGSGSSGGGVFSGALASAPTLPSTSSSSAAAARGGYFGFSITISSAHGDRTRVLYASSAEERAEWLAVLQRAAHCARVEEAFELGRELGHGRFSRVFLATRRADGTRFAVKVINKGSLGDAERELLRTEIAILRLVHHPHIVRLEDVFEGADGNIYIVMELLEGGELFTALVGRARFTEAEARDLVRPLMDSVAYLHALGIVHRDIKPENILCGAASLADVKIADFGLSKLLGHPGEVLRQPCGTLSYVAPEVLTLRGYGKPADLWSIGVILWLVVRGRLPFEGDKETTVKRILEASLDFSHPVWVNWSSEGVDFVRGLLERDPAKRLTARRALQHPWLRSLGEELAHAQQQMLHDTAFTAADAEDA